MGQRTADISRDTFNELLEYLYPVFQKGPNKPLVDADANEGFISLYSQVRRALQIFGDGSPDADAFKVVESAISNVNNFKVKGGDGSGTPDGGGRLVRSGILCRLWGAEVEWDTAGSGLAETIHDKSTSLTAQVLTYTAGQWAVNELVGRQLIPNTVNGTGFVVTSNTATTITISVGDMTTVAAVGDTFRIDPSTPSAPRTDIVYLDIYIDEIDENEDTNLNHPLSGGSSFPSALRFKLKHIVRVRENSTTVPTSPFTDADGNIHYYLKIATFARDANNTITAGEITDEIPRDIFNLAAIRAEIIAARGSKASLDARLDVSVEENGNLKAGVVSDSQVSAAADIDQSKLDNSDTVDDTYTGVPTDLEDDLNRIRNEIKETKGGIDWEAAPTQDLETLNSEVGSARGSKADLDERFDVSINEDGTLKKLAISLSIARLAAEPSMVFYPHDTSPFSKYRLHQFRGCFLKEHGGAAYGPYFNYDLSHIDYPLDVTFGGAAGPGGKDNDATHGIAVAWYHVFLIGKDDGSLALVYSMAGRAPYVDGPLLDASIYDFPANGWKYWKFIAAVRNTSAIAWELLIMRKIGNHVEYELGQRLVGSTAPLAWADTSLAGRVPPTSIRTFLRLVVVTRNHAANGAYLRPPAAGTMLLHEIPSANYSTDNKIFAQATETANASSILATDTGWVGLNTVQEVGFKHDGNGTDPAAYIEVLGYEEFTDFAASELTYS